MFSTINEINLCLELTNKAMCIQRLIDEIYSKRIRQLMC